MDKEIRFFIDCIPPKATAQQKGAFVCNGKVRFFTKNKVRQAESVLASLLMPYRPPRPIDEPVFLMVYWFFPWRKSERKSIVNAGRPVPHTSRPDLDNLEKNMLDVMSRLGYWTDDSIVARKSTGKFWGPRPGIAVHISGFYALES